MTRLSRRSSLFALLALGLVLAAAAYPPAARIFLPSGWGLAPAGRGVPTGDMLAGGVASPNGAWIAFASVGQGVHKAYVVRRNDGRIADTVRIGQGWIGMGWSADSRTLYVSGGTTSRIVRLAVSPEGKFSAPDSIPIPGIQPNRAWIAGLVVRGNEAFIAVSASDKLLKVDLATGKVTGSLSFEPSSTPYQVRASSDGKLYVSLQGSAQVAEVDGAAMKVTQMMATSRHPNDLLIAGERLFVTCGNDDVTEVFDRYTGTREERVLMRPWPDAPPGSTPHAMALSPAGDRVYVALSEASAPARMTRRKPSIPWRRRATRTSWIR